MGVGEVFVEDFCFFGSNVVFIFICDRIEYLLGRFSQYDGWIHRIGYDVVREGFLEQVVRERFDRYERNSVWIGVVY